MGVAREPSRRIARGRVREEPSDRAAARARAASPPDDPAAEVSIDVGAIPAIPRRESPASPQLASALRDYTHERYAEAAEGFQRVLEGDGDDRADRIEEAQFFLAKCLFHLGLFHASARAFDDITRVGPEHRFFDRSLPWLVRLSTHLPDPTDLMGSIERYDPSRIARWADSLPSGAAREHHHHVLYLLGRRRYRAGRFGEAVELLGQVPETSRWALEARLHEGISRVRQGRAAAALTAFRRVIDHADSQHAGHPEARHLAELAWLSTARLTFSMAMRHVGRPRGDALLGRAIAAWRQIPNGSEFWLEAFFEETWALYAARQPARALGHVHALEAPSLRARANPEALVIRATILFEHCQWDAVEETLGEFHERYDPMLRGAERALRMANTHENAFRILAAVRGRGSRVPEAVRPRVREAFADRELDRRLAAVRSIAQERRRLPRVAEGTLGARIADRVEADLALAEAMAVDRAGELATDRLRAIRDELNARTIQMDAVEVELTSARRGELRRPNRSAMGASSGQPVVTVQGLQRWPFDGEYWPDEMAHYEQPVSDRCGN